LKSAEKKLLKRDLQGDLIEFTKYFFEVRGDKFIENWHHRAIADALAKVESGEIKNLLINIPPRYGKTEMAVINWVAFCMARNSKAKFIHLSYSDDLALDNSGKAKELVMSDEYQEMWPIELKTDSQSKKKWYTTEGGGLYATAAGGAITGFGAGSTESDEFAGAIVIDDPIKVDDADRENERKRVNDRLNGTIKSRRNNPRKTPIVLIMQRLHEDDMSGFVINGGMGEEFFHLKLPAIYNGQALWPFKHSLDDLKIEQRADPRTFAGQMMQDPSPEDGDFFKRDWFQRFDLGSQPKDLVNYGASDYAVTDGGGDFTEHGVAGFDKQEDLWIVDWWSGQTAPDVWIDEELRLVEDHEPYTWVAEGGPIRRSIEPFLKREMKSQCCYFRTEWMVSNKNKAANARSFQALASQGKVHIPNTPWGEALITQLLLFPNGKFDDKVDVCGLFGRLLDQAFGPRTMRLETMIDHDGYGMLDDNTDGWKAN